MITGETEAMIAGTESMDNYYGFLGFGAGKPEKEKKEGKFWKDLGGFLKDSGGLEGIANAASTLAGISKKKDKKFETGHYKIGIGEGSKEDLPEVKEPLPMGVWIIGGLVAAGAIALIAGQISKQKK